MREEEFSNLTELGLDELDAVAGGAAGAEGIELDGHVADALPNGMFQVQLDDGSTAMCHLSGQMRMNYVRVVPGDRVRVKTNPSDSSRGRITYRYK